MVSTCLLSQAFRLLSFESLSESVYIVPLSPISSNVPGICRHNPHITCLSGFDTEIPSTISISNRRTGLRIVYKLFNEAKTTLGGPSRA